MITYQKLPSILSSRKGLIVLISAGIFSALLTILSCCSVVAGEDYSFEKVDIGYNSAIGAGFIEDQDGFFWIGGQAGLIKWNGLDSTIYMRGRSGLSNNTVTAIIEDRKGQIWIGTRSGLNKYSKDNNTFVQFKHNPVESNSISHDAIGMINQFQSLIEDRDGYLWVATQNGLNRLDPESGVFTRFLHDPDMVNSISNNEVRAIFEDSAGTIWVGTQNGLNRLNKDRTTFTRFMHNPNSPASLSSNEVNAIAEDTNGDIWIGTENGLNKFDILSESFVHYTSQSDKGGLLADKKITSITRDRSGRFWMFHYSQGSITVLDPITLQSKIYSYTGENHGKLPTGDAKYMYEDRRGIIWLISTTGGNVYKHDVQSRKFVTYKDEAGSPHGLKGDSILPIYEDSNGVVWLGTDKNKLNKFDKTSGQFTYIPLEGHHPYAFLEDDSGTFWIGETTGKLSIFDRKTKTYSKSYPGISSSFITNIIQDSQDAAILWLTTHKDGLVRFNSQTEEVRHFKNDPNNPASLSNNSVWAIWQDGNTLWLGTWGGGLNRFNKEQETFKVYSHNPEKPDTISSNASCNLLITSSGDLYISTLGGGLNKFNRTNNSFEHYSTLNGTFPSDNLEGLLEDNKGNIWVASSTEEIIKFNPTTLDYKVYGPGDGIEIGGPWFVANHKTRDGQMWFGGPRGVTAFYPELIMNNDFSPPVYITSITQGGEVVVTDKAVEKVSKINISWKKPFFEFGVAALNYTRPEHNRYRYKLEGWDSDWFSAGTLRNGRYSNLKGGVYTLRVAGSNNDGIWCQPKQEAILTIVVSSPFWRATWFLLLLTAGIILFTGCVIIYLVRLRSEITARRKNEHALRESELKYRNLIDNAPDLRYRTDMEGKIVFVSASIQKLSGYSQEEAIGMRMAEEIYVNPEERDEFLSLLNDKGHVENFEAQLKKKDGSTWWASTSAHFFKDLHGSILGVEGVTRDMTERKSLQERLQQAQKMEAIGTLAGGIAHDFNNILSVVIGYAEMARDDSPTGSVVAKDLEQVLEASSRAKELVKQILSFSRQSEAKCISFVPASLVKETLKMLRPTLPSTIEIIQEIEPQTKPIFADPTQINQILMNLCTNAYHAMENRGGTLRVSLKEAQLNREDLRFETTIEAGTFIQLSVRDSGTGIPAEVAEKIYDPFFTTKKVGKGTGMGLAIVHGIVRSCGGFISLDNRKGEGATFHVFLPVYENNAHTDNRVAAADKVPTGHEKILFIDDEEILAKMGKDMLTRLGYNVTVKNDSFDALKTFQQQPDQFDLVITDQTMPGMTGADLSRRMLQIRPDIPIILCTGYSTIISEKEAKAIGIKEFALKPLAKKDIAVLIRNVFDNNLS